uniref:Uncharacterized protein n=1 Tax=Rhizophora mucronata TaxID=61149 RepID=A0A2P2P3L2_RHIMU
MHAHGPELHKQLQKLCFHEQAHMERLKQIKGDSYKLVVPLIANIANEGEPTGSHTDVVFCFSLSFIF